MISDIFVMRYQPQVRQRVIANRVRSSFMLVQKGKYHYHSSKIDFDVDSGNVIFLPQGASYEYHVLSDMTQCIQVEFRLEPGQNFCQEPTVIRQQSIELHPVFHDLLQNYQNDQFKVLSLLYYLLSIFYQYHAKTGIETDGSCRIAPAVNYIRKNYTKKIYISELAGLCSLSEVHLRRLFQKYVGCSPIQYKNMILLQAACDILRSEHMNVSETADALEFGDIYTFSQFFHKGMGISPSEYMRREEGITPSDILPV